MSARVIAVANQKGGVGKTVTSINVAATLAKTGRRVLLIDLDPQGHCGVGLGLDIESLERTTHDLLVAKHMDVDEIILQPVDELPTLSLIPSNLTLALAERDLNRHESVSNLALATRLRDIKPHFDDIILDCPPALSKLSLNAFLACDLVVIPVGVGFFSIHGLRMLAETLRDIYDETGLDYEIRCLITRYRAGQTVSRDVKDAASEMFGDFCFRTVIRENVDVEKSIGAQSPLTVFAPKCAAARDYEKLVDELLGLQSSDEVSGEHTLASMLMPPSGVYDDGNDVATDDADSDGGDDAVDDDASDDDDESDGGVEQHGH